MTIHKRFLTALACVLFLASCASKPPVQPEEPIPVEEPVIVVEEAPVIEAPPEPVPDPHAELRQELPGLHDKVLRLRVLAVELEANTRLPERYKAANQAYLDGKSALDAEQLPEAQEALLIALDLFEALVKDSYSAAIARQKSLIAQFKAAAEKVNAAALSPEHLAGAAGLEREAAEFEATGDSAKALAHYTLIRQVYDAAEKRSRALTVKSRIDELGYASADGGNYQLAGQKLNQSDGLWETNPSQALDAMEEALLRYNLVLNKGWELLSGTRRAKAEDYKRRADEIRANIAVANEYNLAKMIWDNALEASRSNNHEYAATLFEQSEELFTLAYLSARRKREAAEAAMAATVEQQARSRALALEADNTLGLSDEAEQAATTESDAAPETDDAREDTTDDESKGE